MNPPEITASVTADGVRIAAPNAAVQLRLEVFDELGQKLFDSEQQGGNVVDWHLQAGTGARLMDGKYLCVVTITNPSGQLRKKLGLVTLTGRSVSVRSAVATELSLLQTQVVGPIEGEDNGLAVVTGATVSPMLMINHTGGEAQLTRTRGPLSFRFGDFFSGNDHEQMRLTEEGNLGIGTSKPEAKLDVAGTVRAQGGIVFGDGSVLTSANDLKQSTTTLGLTKLSDGNSPNLAGTGTTGKLSKWIDNAGTLGDSGITDLNGNIGIGTSSPSSTLHLSGPGGASALTLDTPGNQKFRLQSVPNVQNWGALTLNANYQNGWNLDDINTNGWFFKLDTRGGNSANDSNGLWLWRVPNGPNPHTNEYPVFGVTNGRVFFSDNVGINTTAPTQKLEVNGNIKVSGAGNGIIFPDGTKQTTAGGGGSMNGTSIVNALNDSATVGAISDTRLTPNIPKLNTANTFNAGQTVNGNVTVNGMVESTSGGVKFPDGSVQTSAPDKVYTNFSFSTFEIAAPGATSSIAELNLPPGSYMVTASVQFENHGFFNKRLVECQMIDEALWFGRVDGSGGVTDYLPVTLHTVITHGGNIKLYCQAIDGGSGHSNVFATARRLTAVRIGDLVTQ